MIFADIREVSGVPMINSIWRQFASMPGALEWAWTAVRPLVASAELERARSRIADAVILPPLKHRTQADWALAGVDATSFPRVRAILASYLRANLTNVVALTALRLRLEAPERLAARLTPGEVPSLALPPESLPQIETLPKATIAQIRALSAKHEIIGGNFVPALYLALAEWPGLLLDLPDWLGPIYAGDAHGSPRRDSRDRDRSRCADSCRRTSAARIGGHPITARAFHPIDHS